MFPPKISVLEFLDGNIAYRIKCYELDGNYVEK